MKIEIIYAQFSGLFEYRLLCTFGSHKVSNIDQILNPSFGWRMTSNSNGHDIKRISMGFRHE
jgi:hypothetical protein